MKRRLIYVTAALTVTISSISWNSFSEEVLANETLKNEISEVEAQRNETQEQAKQTEEELRKVEAEMADLNEEIRQIDHDTTETNEKIRTKKAEIEVVESEIEQLKEEIAILEERIAERDEILKDRAKSMYQSGGSINYLEVVLGAKNFGDFLDRVNALTVIAQQDRNILEAHVADQEALEQSKAEVEEKLTVLEGHLIELEGLMAQLEEQRKEKDRLMAIMEVQQGALHTDLGILEEEEQILKAQEAALKQQLAEYEAEQARLAAEAKAAEGTARTQTSASTSSASSGSSSSPSSSSNTTHSTPDVTDVGFMRPATGSITSTYGPRATFGGRMHHGIDIGKNGRTGDVPIVAVEQGQVLVAQYSSSYGNYVIISHIVNGQQISTLYAHLERLDVSAGSTVSKGQQLGLMGNTGNSFGAHLHFEVHIGGWNGAKSNSVDPLKYIPR